MKSTVPLWPAPPWLDFRPSKRQGRETTPIEVKMSEPLLFASPLLEVGLTKSADGTQAIVALRTALSACAAQLTSIQTAELAVGLLHWASTHPDPGDQMVNSSPITPIDLVFEAARAPDHILLTVDIGIAHLRFEVPHAQLGAALAQLDFKAKPGPVTN